MADKRASGRSLDEWINLVVEACFILNQIQTSILHTSFFTFSLLL